MIYYRVESLLWSCKGVGAKKNLGLLLVFTVALLIISGFVRVGCGTSGPEIGISLVLEQKKDIGLG